MTTDASTRYPRLAALFGLDLRSLALLRCGLGLLLLAQLLCLLPDLRALYSDAGVFSRSWIIGSESSWRWSLHFLNGTGFFTALLWLLQLGAALLLLLGWRARLAALASFVLYASLMNRNPVVATQADAWLLGLLFWLSLLPAGARYAVDAALAPRSEGPSQHLSWASAGLVLQVLAVFVVTALAQRGVEWREQGSALYYALSIDHEAAPLGRWLLQFPRLLALLTAAVWWTALVAPLLALSPLLTRPLRAVALGALLLLQLGLILVFDLGALPWIGLFSLGALIGGGFWDWRSRASQERHPAAPRVFYDRDCESCARSVRLLQQFLILPRAELAPAQDNPRARALFEANRSWVVIDGEEHAHLRWAGFVALLRQSPLFWPLAGLAARPRVAALGDRLYARAAAARDRRHAPTRLRAPEQPLPLRLQLLAAAVLGLLILANLAQLRLLPVAVAGAVEPLVLAMRLDQPWRLWAPAPPAEHGWIVAAGRATDGSEVDLLDPAHGAPDYAAPTQRAGGARWRLLERRLGDPRYAAQLPHYARYLCRRWNADEPQRPLGGFRITYMLQRTPPPDSPPNPVEQQVLWRQDCSPSPYEGVTR